MAKLNNVSACPFCGNSELEEDGGIFSWTAQCFAVNCGGCGTIGPCIESAGLDKEAHKQAAIQRWNQRTASAAE